jgi:hypothetical protein
VNDHWNDDLVQLVYVHYAEMENVEIVNVMENEILNVDSFHELHYLLDLEFYFLVSHLLPVVMNVEMVHVQIVVEIVKVLFVMLENVVMLLCGNVQNEMA